MSLIPLSMENKVAIITGASSGIGRGVAVDFAKKGCKLVLTGRAITSLMFTKGLCVAQGIPTDSVLTIQADMMKTEDVERIIPETIERFGRLDIVFHNAGSVRVWPNIEDYPMELYHEQMQVNVHSVVLLTKLAVPYLEKTKGSIIMNSSIAGKRPIAGFWVYCMTKAAVDHFCRSLSLDLAPKGIRVNSINPGNIVTNIHFEALKLTGNQYEGVLKAWEGIHALGRPGDIGEVASVVSFLVSEKAAQTTGACVSMDGGTHAMAWLQPKD